MKMSCQDLVVPPNISSPNNIHPNIYRVPLGGLCPNQQKERMLPINFIYTELYTNKVDLKRHPQ